jgi:uncharacterized protein YbjT (DUF2867 family)
MILVTGATGFVGRSLIRELQQKGYPTRSFQGRINDSFTVRKELDGVVSVIHLAGAEAQDRVRLLEHVDVEGTEQLLRESQRVGVEHFIYLSRINADAFSSFPLLRIKGKVEKIVQRSEIPYTIVRSGTLFGRDDRYLNVIAGLAAWTWPIVWVPGGGEVAVQPLWVEDLVRCLVACLDRPDLQQQTIHLAGEERMRYKDVVRAVLSASGMRRWSISPSIKLVRPLSALFFGWWRKAPVTRFFMDRIAVPEVAPVDTVWSHFGFRPALLNQQVSFLRRSDLRWHFFRLG